MENPKSEMSPEQLERVKTAIINSIYEEIGRSIVKKVIWIAGVLFIVLLSWMGAKGYIPPSGPK